MKASHYLLALVCLIVGVLIGMNFKKPDQGDDLVKPQPSNLSLKDLTKQSHEWYRQVDTLPAYFSLSKEEALIMSQVLQEIPDGGKAAVGFLVNSPPKLYVATFNGYDSGSYKESYIISSAPEVCPPHCDLIEAPRERIVQDISSPKDSNSENQDPQEPEDESQE